jgi:hypothetical protein
VEVQTAGAIFNLFIVMPDEGSHVPAILAYAGVEVQLHLFVTSALGGGEWYLLPWPLYPEERVPSPMSIEYEAGNASIVSLYVFEMR